MMEKKDEEETKKVGKNKTGGEKNEGREKEEMM